MGTKETDGYRDALVTFKGSNGTGCGTFSFDHFSHEAADGEAYERVRTLEDFDGDLSGTQWSQLFLNMMMTAMPLRE